MMTIGTERLNDYVCPEALVHWAEKDKERMRRECLEKDIEIIFLDRELFKKDLENKRLRREVKDLEKLLTDRSTDHYTKALESLVKVKKTKILDNRTEGIIESLMVRNEYLEKQLEEFLALKMKLGIE